MTEFGSDRIPTDDLIAAQAGNTDARDRFLGAVFAEASRISWRRVGDYHVAEDLAAEVMFKTWRDLSKLNPEGNVKAWVHVVCRRVSVDQSRTNARQPFSLDALIAQDPTNEPTSSTLDPSEETIMLAEAQDLRTAIKSLPLRQRQSIELDLEGYAEKEIAEKIGSARNKVASYKRKGRNNLSKNPRLRHWRINHRGVA